MTTAILSIISGILGLLLWWLKKRESPIEKRKTTLDDMERRIDESKEVLETPGLDDDIRDSARRRDDILRETDSLYPGSGDKGDG